MNGRTRWLEEKEHEEEGAVWSREVWPHLEQWHARLKHLHLFALDVDQREMDGGRLVLEQRCIDNLRQRDGR